MATAIKPEVVELIVPAQAKYLMIVRKVAAAIAQPLNFNSQIINDLKTAVGEACLNVTQHAYPKDRIHSTNENLILRFLIYPIKLEFIVKDMGCGFDSTFVQKYIPRRDAGNPERLKMGLHIIRELVDEIEIDSQFGRGTQIRMTKYLPIVGEFNSKTLQYKEISHE